MCWPVLGVQQLVFIRILLKEEVMPRPLLHVETPPREVLEALANERNPLYEEIADVTIRTDDQSAKVVANQIIHMLESN